MGNRSRPARRWATGRGISACLALGVFISHGAGRALGQEVQRIELQCARTEIIADGRDSAIIEALVTVDRQGTPAPDGTMVYFGFDIGTVEPAAVPTENGRAVATFTVQSQTESEATIRARAGTKISEAPIRLKIVRERQDEEKGSRFLEIKADNLAYLDKSAMLIAYGGCQFSYRTLAIRADSLQFSVPDFILKASDAEVSNGETTLTAAELYVEFGHPQTRGVALIMEPTPHTLYFTNERFFEAQWSAPSDKFRRWDTGESKLVIRSKRAIIHPGQKLTLQPAKMYYQDVHVFTLSARELSLGPELPDAPQFFGYNASGPVVDFPWYFTTRPTHTGRVRLRYGSPFGVVSGREGFYVDTEFEFHTNGGGDGKLVVDGLLTPTYGATLRYTHEFDDGKRGSAYISWPQHSYLTANANLWRSGRSVDNIINARVMGGGSLSTTYSLDSSWNFKPKSTIGGWRWQYSLDTQFARDSYDTRPYLEGGVRLRLHPGKLYQFGNKVSLSPRISGGAWLDTLGRTETLASGSADLNFNITNGTVLGLSYSAEHRHGGRFTTGFSHSVTARLNAFSGERWWTSASATYNLTNGSSFGVAYGSWEFIPKWHLDASALFQRYGLASFSDYMVALGRDIGGQQARIVYSTSEGRLYFELRRAGGFFTF